MVLAYDGTNYHGFQVQNRTGLKTIQGELEKALRILTNEQVTVNGSGRTDAGVHAQGQVINFRSSSAIPAERFPLAINSLLPRDIVVWQAQDAAEDFHARYSAKKKTYCYTIYNTRYSSPFWRYYALHVPVYLDLDAMKRGAEIFLGTHDFSAFCAKDSAVADHIRTVYECSIQQEGPLVRLFVTGNGFLYNMVRIMMGTLLEIGQDKQKPEDLRQILAGGERKDAGMTLPPKGLCLCSVEY